MADRSTLVKVYLDNFDIPIAQAWDKIESRFFSILAFYDSIWK